MKLTPLDIHHKEFRHSLRGYAEDEVDAFLDQVADEFERLFKENIDMSERLEAANARVREYQQMEQTLQATMVSAQRSAEDIVNKAGVEADTTLRDAEVKAKEIIHNALSQKQKVQAALVRIKQAEEEFRAGFRTMLERYSADLRELPLPDDVTVLMGETDDGFVGEVEVAEFSAVPAPAQAPAPARIDVPPAQPTAAMPAVMEEPPVPGFVQSVSLGEVGTPDVVSDEVELGDPSEFSLPSFDALGEREDDLDIEEID